MVGKGSAEAQWKRHFSKWNNAEWVLTVLNVLSFHESLINEYNYKGQWQLSGWRDITLIWKIFLFFFKCSHSNQGNKKTCKHSRTGLVSARVFSVSRAFFWFTQIFLHSVLALFLLDMLLKTLYLNIIPVINFGQGVNCHQCLSRYQ